MPPSSHHSAHHMSVSQQVALSVISRLTPYNMSPSALTSSPNVKIQSPKGSSLLKLDNTSVGKKVPGVGNQVGALPAASSKVTTTLGALAVSV